MAEQDKINDKRKYTHIQKKDKKNESLSIDLIDQLIYESWDEIYKEYIDV